MSDMSDFEQWFAKECQTYRDGPFPGAIKYQLRNAFEAGQAAIASMQGEAVEITNDSKLPFAIRIGNGSVGKGCKFSTLLLRINAHNEWFANQGFHLMPEKDAEIARLQKELEEADKWIANAKSLAEEARDALPAIPMSSARLHNIDLTLAERMDEHFTKPIDAVIRQIGGAE